MLVGHKKQWNFLKRTFEAGRLPHAFLFSGQEQLGKKTLAKEFVKLIIGQDIEKEEHLNVLIVDLKDEKQEIGISQIREVLNFLSYKPYHGSLKTVIIDGAEKMNLEAQSCFLKTLEDPKGKTLLILISSRAERLLTTIQSRCQIIKFCDVNKKEIENYLISVGAKQKQAFFLAEFCQGKPGRAMDLFLNPEKLEKDKKEMQELIKIVNSDLAEKFQYTKTINLENSNLKNILGTLQNYLRHLLFLKIGVANSVSQNYFSDTEGNFKNYSVIKVKEILKLLQNIDIKTSLTNANPKLALEILLMEI